jgi:hypothetical protein
VGFRPTTPFGVEREPPTEGGEGEGEEGGSEASVHDGEGRCHGGYGGTSPPPL